jgi:hypothetical protein
MFNETTHRASKMEPKTEKLWMIWRATLAEQFSTSLDDFFRFASLEASGTYMNGYMVADTKTREIGLVEMSYANFAFFKPDGSGGYNVTIKGPGTNTAYDTELVTEDYILGINFPASLQVRDDLQSTDNRPARRVQFRQGIGTVNNIETAKALITYTDPANPLSIYGRWDLGYGQTDYPKTVTDGSIDAKAVSAKMIDYTKDLTGVLDIYSPYKSFWMKFGTTYVNGEPFIWSKSQWPNTKLRDCPDRVDGSFQHLNLYIK